MVAQARKKPPVKTGPREKSIILTSMQAAVVDATLQGKHTATRTDNKKEKDDGTADENKSGQNNQGFHAVHSDQILRRIMA